VGLGAIILAYPAPLLPVIVPTHSVDGIAAFPAIITGSVKIILE
jgi:hypothetical protein